MKGFFITFEGPDGSGKSTQVAGLKAYLEDKKMNYLLTREPGGTEISEAIRRVILNKDYMEMTDKTEVLLYAASRAQHVEEVIVPALHEGKIVICDRYVDSSIVYQGMARNIGIEAVKSINKWATGGLEPDLTILLDLDFETGLLRKQKQKDLDRLELQHEQFYKKVVEGYQLIRDENKARILSVNATLTVEEIHSEIICALQKLLKGGNNL